MIVRSPRLPFARSYWPVPGRLLAGYYPGDHLPHVAEQKLQGLVDCGVTAVVSLIEADEVGHGGVPFRPYVDALQALGAKSGREIECHRHAIRDLGVPSAAGMVQILDKIDDLLAQERVVYAHCWGGRGRTGSVVGCYLMRHGLAAQNDVLARLQELTDHERALFRRVPETPEQQDFVRSWRAGQ